MTTTTANRIRPGDTVTYCGETFHAHRVGEESNGLVRVETNGRPTQFIAYFREVEIDRDGADEPRYFVEKQSYERDCENPACAITCRARGLHNVTHDRPFTDRAWLPQDDPAGPGRLVHLRTAHCVTVTTWVVIDREDPQNCVESFDTRRAARRAAARLNERS